MVSFKSIVLNFLLSFGLFCASFYLAWQVCASVNFFYSSWYEVLDIDETISTYAPKNKHRHGFEQTSKQEQVRLFAGIVDGIQNEAKGLSGLGYVNSNGKVIDTLLTDAEIIHLKYVADLVSNLKYLAITVGLLALISFALIVALKTTLATIKYHSIGGLGFLVVAIVFILLIGPTKIFYAGHALVFPNNHQWFFYYEDSLMSTMMKAPALFAPIAAELVIITVGFWIILLTVIRYLQNYMLKPKD